MILSCTEAGKLLNMSKEGIRELVDKDVLSNYGNSHRYMIHEDDVKEYIKLLNSEVNKLEFEVSKMQIKRLYESNYLKELTFSEENKKTKITYSQLEREIFRAKEELEERIFEVREKNPQNEKAIFQYQCEIRGIDRVLEILEIQKGNREVL